MVNYYDSNNTRHRYTDFSGISDILRGYAKDIQEQIKDEGERIGRDSANELKHTSPKRSGKYARNWTVDIGKKYNADKGISEFSVIVHNKKAYQLTHLLENPHLKRNGQLSKPISHIYPVEQKAVKEFTEKVEQIIGGTV